MTRRLCLASASPRRQELLAQLGIPFFIEAPEVDETPQPREAPAEYVTRLARDKALVVAKRNVDALVLGADTIVVLGESLLGKPRDLTEADAMLARLSGREHSVWTGVALEGTARALLAVETRVTFRELGPAERAWYIGTGEPMGKAGAYAIQGVGSAFVLAIAGSYTNVVGLPLAETLSLLREAGVALPWSDR